MPSAIVDICRECHSLVTDFLALKVPYPKASKRSRILNPYPDFHNDDKLHQKTQEQVVKSMKIFAQALDKYTLEELSISYNGGKDCLVMLVIYLAAIYEKYENQLLELKSSKLSSVYINNEIGFPEQDDFLYYSVMKYQLSLTKIKDQMKSGFQRYLDQNPKIKAIAVGIRRIDPYGENLAYVQHTDHGWPAFYRINPVLDWTYCEIWYFIKATNIEYCSLYDQGYTSIGGIDNTVKNPLLRLGDKYLPAYMLDDDCHERLSRCDKKEVDSRENRPEEKL
ncbi:hypothetical protein KL920_001142 [Ogataea angusta]|uniref:FAD synthase n=1 Tax=Pichia angusta TaxID=870730 RepID=A0AAN6DN34_PICAN|nr:uncharacterized protein KL928_000749 [Ogataea angusta]KAG7822274.1 hypothetical protein KL928_000749 [Ogataea angusta]KAG7831622.1 hypothetical protein KL920_001142 [Ogataea angusta]KAG7832351.1 hypothetical protein KL943_005009 [Ogataea angusta]KAG7853699.1 hypothetical protein KL941_000749 [Ogataea angusta]